MHYIVSNCICRCNFFQAVELLVCDWLLTTRTEIWQENRSQQDAGTVCHTELLAFQNDLCSLRKIAQNVKSALSRVLCYLVNLHVWFNYLQQALYI